MRSRWEQQFEEILPWVCGYSANKAMPHHREVKVMLEHIIDLSGAWQDSELKNADFRDQLARLTAVADAARALYDVVDPTDCYESEHCALGAALSALDGSDRG